jgi:rhodanese-related sulfurtransferase
LPFIGIFRIVPARGRAVAARRAHNPEVVGSNPTPATNFLEPNPKFQVKLKAMQIHTLSAQEMIEKLKNPSEKEYILDVRTQREFEHDHLKGASNISIQSLQNEIDEIPKDKDIIVYCLHGVRSGQAAHYLLAEGYTRVAHVNGGLEQIRSLQ